jgi:GT2 family glycosyltransferase
MQYHRPVTSRDPDISVVVPTLPSRKLNSLPHLTSQSDINHEVVVVNDDSLSISEARNAGVRLVNSDYIALTDDDTRPPTDWLATVHDVLRQNGTHLVEGPVVGENHSPGVYPGCNVGFSREAWNAVGGFDSTYSGWMEDSVFGWEVEQTLGDEATRFVPEMEMEHIGPLRSNPIHEHECRCRREYKNRYFEVYRSPNTIKGRIFVTVARHTYDIAPSLWDRLL